MSNFKEKYLPLWILTGVWLVHKISTLITSVTALDGWDDVSIYSVFNRLLPLFVALLAFAAVKKHRAFLIGVPLLTVGIQIVESIYMYNVYADLPFLYNFQVNVNNVLLLILCVLALVSSVVAAVLTVTLKSDKRHLASYLFLVSLGLGTLTITLGLWNYNPLFQLSYNHIFSAAIGAYVAYSVSDKFTEKSSDVIDTQTSPSRLYKLIGGYRPLWTLAGVWLGLKLILYCAPSYTTGFGLSELFVPFAVLSSAAPTLFAYLAMKKHRAFLIGMPLSTLLLNPANWIVIWFGLAMTWSAVTGFAKHPLQSLLIFMLFAAYALLYVATVLTVTLKPHRRHLAAWLFLAALVLEAPLMLVLAFDTPAITMLYPDFVFPLLLGALVAYNLRQTPDEQPPAAETAEPVDPLTAEVQEVYNRIHTED